MIGVGDLTKLNIAAGDEGGELDPHGADGNGKEAWRSNTVIYVDSYSRQPHWRFDLLLCVRPAATDPRMDGECAVPELHVTHADMYSCARTSWRPMNSVCALARTDLMLLPFASTSMM